MARHPSEDILNDWLEGILSSQESKKVENHCSSCQTCQASVTDIKMLIHTYEHINPKIMDSLLIEKTVSAWQKELGLGIAPQKSLLKTIQSELFRPFMLASVTIGLIFGLILGNLASSLLQADINQMAVYASVSQNNGQSQGFYLEQLTLDYGTDL